MQRKRRSKSTLRTDRNTDHMFEYFFNENKFNSQLKEEWDDQMEKKLQDHQNRKNNPQSLHESYRNEPLGSKTSDSKVRNDVTSSLSEKKEDYHHHASNKNGNRNYDFADTESDVSEHKPNERVEAFNSESNTLSNSVTSDRKKRKRGKTYAQTDHSYFTRKQENAPPRGYGKPHDEFYPVQRETLPPMAAAAPPPPKMETPEERRSRQRVAYAQLQKLQKDHKVSLTREFNQYDDPDDMEAEYRLHRDQRKKEVSVNTYGRAILTIISIIELANSKFDPFSIKLDGWSTQFGSEMDEHREILEELYDKYKGKGGGYPPELRLLFAIIFSAITFHLSQLFMGSESLKSIIHGNPDIFNRVYAEVANPNEPTPQNKGHPMDNKSILDHIKSHNEKRRSEALSQTQTQTQTVSLSETSTAAPPRNSAKNNNEAKMKQEEMLNRRQLEQMRLRHEQEMMRQAHIHNQQMSQLQQQNPAVHTVPPVVATPTNMPKNLFQHGTSKSENPVNKVLSELNVPQPTIHPIPKIVINSSGPTVDDDPFANIENADEIDGLDGFPQMFNSDADPKFESEKSHKLEDLNDILNIISDSSFSDSLEKTETKTNKKPKNKTQSLKNASLSKTSSLTKGGSAKKIIRIS